MKTENMTKKQAIDFLTEYAKCGIHLNYPSNPEKSLNKMEECIAVLTDTGSVAAPKEEPKEESEPTQRINAAMLLAGFMWKDENKFPKQCVTIHHEKGVSIDETELLPYLMYLVRWVEDAHQLSSLRDQLRQRDELIKELQASIKRRDDATANGPVD